MAGNNNHNGYAKGGVGSSEKNSKVRKTSGWRTFRPVFVSGKCRGCGICVQHCPEGCIELHQAAGMKTKVARVDYDYCKGCLLCMVLCPFKAVDKMLEK